jgi:hypothetical protein
MKARELLQGLAVSLILLLAVVNNVVADTPVSGPITSDATWTLANSPYIVTGNVLVMNGVTLTIEPGVTVKFDSAKALQIDGTLIARGTSSNKVTFTSNQATPAAGDWGYILFSDSSTDATYDGTGNYIGGSILEYCIVEYAGGVSVSNNGAVRINNAHPFINYCTIRNNSVSGIYAYNLSLILKVNNSTIANNIASVNASSLYEGGGIYVSGGTAIISNNTIMNNTTPLGFYGFGGGIYIDYLTLTNAVISNNTIMNNTAQHYGGGVYTEGGTIIIVNNTIKKNISGGYGGGFFAYGSISNNIVIDNFAYTGGGGEFKGGILSNNIICNNIASQDGGGIACGGAPDIGTISDNIIADNAASGIGGGISLSYSGTLTGNSIIRNSARDVAAMSGAGDFICNTITGNKATGPSLSSIVKVTWGYSSLELFNQNNIFNNIATYELWNDNAQGSADVNAESNWWGTSVESEVQAKIYDWFDDSEKGIVDYSPYEIAMRTDAPISPPTGLAVTATDTDIIMSWNANPEADVAGYKVYWGTQPSPFFENVTDIGNSLGHTITGLAPGTYYVGVTAYDASYVAANDDPGTIVNENQTNGNESWYATTIVVVGTPEPKILTLLAPNGGETLLAGNIFTINWQSEGPITDFLIEYSTNNGLDWVTIGTTSNTGSYEWLVPLVTSDQCLVVITDATNSAITDTSDDMFTIIKCSRLIPSDLNKDCYVDLYDFAAFAEDWLKCSNPLDPDCVP